MQLKDKITDKNSIPNIIKNLQQNILFYSELNNDPESIIKNKLYTDHPQFLKFNCIALRRIMEFEKLSLSDIQKLIAFVPINPDRITVLKTFMHERKDLLGKDIVRERRRKFMMIEDKINNLEILDISKQEFEFDEIIEEYEFKVKPEHIPYYTQLAEYEFLRATNETQILIQTYPYIKNILNQEFLDIFLVDIQEMVMMVQDYREYIRKEKRRLLDEKFNDRQRGK
jgi:hypothetical protein